jgi:hypothetical protein
VAVQLLVFGPFKFSPVEFFGYPSYPEKFVAWGYPPWFSFVIGALEINLLLAKPSLLSR